MWTVLTDAFLSIVEKGGGTTLRVRARQTRRWARQRSGILTRRSVP